MAEKETVRGTVSKITRFGAYVKLEDGREGFVHISQISNDYVRAVEDYLRVGDEIEGQVVRVNEKGVVELTLKGGEEVRPKEKKPADPSFEKMLRDYMRRSEESHGILKRRREGKK